MSGYHVLPGVALGTTVLGGKFVAGSKGVAGDVASAMLPVTGLAFGLYLALGLGLLVAGFAMRLSNRARGRSKA